MAKRIAILGSTGSIGTSALAVVRELRDRFAVVGLAAGRRGRELAEQAAEFAPEWVALDDPAGVPALAAALAGGPTAVLTGPAGVREGLERSRPDLVLVAVVGAAGLDPALAAADLGADLALANKESLVIAGPLLKARVEAAGGRILPVDSEHSAIFQALQGQPAGAISRIILTASGGPCRELSAAELEAVTPATVLDHPTWQMGPKITTDSATLMNKALEVIEACQLFPVRPDQVSVVIHPQSIVHSFVAFNDGSTLAQLGWPDMRVPIQYALTWPERRAGPVQAWDPASGGDLTFAPPDPGRFPALKLGFEAARRGGTAGAALSAANEVAVERFLAGKLKFTAIARLAGRALAEHPFQAEPDLAAIMDCDRWVRNEVEKWADCSPRS